jgi:hypothetical protein
LDNRPIVRITGLSYTNAPDTSVDQPDGINVGNTTFMVNLHNYGGADAVLADSSFVVSNAAPNTGLTCTGGNNLPITGTITAGQNNSTPITLSCHYDHPNERRSRAPWSSRTTRAWLVTPWSEPLLVHRPRSASPSISTKR